MRMRPKQPRARKSAQDSSLPKYSIAVASDLSGVSQQQLRRLEEGGLVQPGRTSGNTRRYSDGDLEQIADVSLLSDEGINAAGIRHILLLRDAIAALREENAALRAELAAHSGDNGDTDGTAAAATASTSGPHDAPDKTTTRNARPAR